MHELGIAHSVLELIEERAAGARVSRIVMEIGRLTAVLPDALRFAFEVASEGTGAQGAALEIIEIPARARCRTCDTTAEFDEPWGVCACGSMDLEWLAGNELRLKGMEVM